MVLLLILASATDDGDVGVVLLRVLINHSGRGGRVAGRCRGIVVRRVLLALILWMLRWRVLRGLAVRDSLLRRVDVLVDSNFLAIGIGQSLEGNLRSAVAVGDDCLLYTSDAADDAPRV